MVNKSVEYLLSTHILKDLKSRNLITEEEFIAIDIENKKSFQMAKNQGINLIS
ncbi:SHOCT domain-containing protein [Natronincola ferrireducens]|uniref:SHOCT-like domain-containing protein n=1 Tax=Natronincola ferrireducens TaxID=393762 RepID=A0A1G9IIG1_9FIRM|nr:SHOCT domain-containing protein [Natronincola ferrireducens]SDL24694.1 hypothetical protein SAMN05660472_02875 [Natronincola ferrireducens]